jgi:N-acetylglucosamine-6-phosphate deacetylase
VADLWLSHGKLITPSGIRQGAVRIVRGRIAAIRAVPPKGVEAVNLQGSYLAPGFIDLHIWGDPQQVSRESARQGTTAFLSAIGPEPPGRLVKRLAQLREQRTLEGAQCLGAHLEGPFLNPKRAGALPRLWMRQPAIAELRALVQVGGARLMTVAPELPGARESIRWCRRHRVVVSLGHSDAEASSALRAVEAGATAVTHVFNGMRPLHHRRPTLLNVALTEPRLTAMVILDGVHVSPYAFRLLLRVKGPAGIALVTDSIRYQPGSARLVGNAFYSPKGILAGSRLTMMKAVQHAMVFGRLSLAEAIRMATETPARLLGLGRELGAVEVGRRADLVGFDRHFCVHLTVVGGRVVYQRGW